MPDLSGFDLDAIATALADQDSDEHAWLVNPGPQLQRAECYCRPATVYLCGPSGKRFAPAVP